MLQYSQVEEGMKVYVVTVRNTSYEGVMGPPILEFTVKSKETKRVEPTYLGCAERHELTVSLVDTASYLYGSTYDVDARVLNAQLQFVGDARALYTDELFTDRASAEVCAQKILRRKAGTIKRVVNSLRADLANVQRALAHQENTLALLQDLIVKK